MKKNRIFPLLCVCCLSVVLIAVLIQQVSANGIGTGPGGVSQTDGTGSLVLWLDAGQLTGLAGNDPVVVWPDVSGYGHTVSQTVVSNQPRFQTAVLNNQPVVRFDGSDLLLGPDADSLDDTAGLTIFSVVRPLNLNGSPRGIVSKRISWNNNSAYSLFFFSGNRLYADVDSHNNRFNTNATFASSSTYLTELVYDGSLPANERAKIYLNGTVDITATEFSTAIPNTNSPLTIGDLNPGRNAFFEGDIAEVIIYRTALSSAERIIVENYLGAKYDLTVANPRYAGSSNANGDYDVAVAGIGQQSDGRNAEAHSAGLILQEANASMTDGDSLLAGHNVRTNTNVPAAVEPQLATLGVDQRWSRVWYLDRTGPLTATLSFDFSEAGLSGSPAAPATNYVLLYSASDPFSWSVAVDGATALNNDQVVFAVDDATLVDGYYTLGTRDADSSPTSIALLSFSVGMMGNTAVIVVLSFLALISLLMMSQHAKVFWNKK